MPKTNMRILALALFVAGIPLCAARGGEAADHDDVRVYLEGEVTLTRNASRGPASAEPWKDIARFDSIVKEYADVSYHYSGFLDPISLQTRIHACSIGVQAPGKEKAAWLSPVVMVSARELGGQRAFGCGGFASVVLHRLRYGAGWEARYRQKIEVREGGEKRMRYLHQLSGSDIAAAMGLQEAGVMTLTGKGESRLRKGDISAEIGALPEGLYFFAASTNKAGHVGFVRLSFKDGKPLFAQWHVSSTVSGRPKKSFPISGKVNAPGKVEGKDVRIWVTNLDVRDEKAIRAVNASIAVKQNQTAPGKTEIELKNFPLDLAGGLATGSFLDWWRKSQYKTGKVILYALPQGK